MKRNKDRTKTVNRTTEIVVDPTSEKAETDDDEFKAAGMIRGAFS